MPDLDRLRRDRRRGNLDEIVTLKLATSIDRYGDPVAQIERMSWARVEDAEVELEASGTRVTTWGDVRFVIPFMDGVATGDLIEHSGKTYKILRIAEVGRRAYLERGAVNNRGLHTIVDIGKRSSKRPRKSLPQRGESPENGKIGWPPAHEATPEALNKILLRPLKPVQKRNGWAFGLPVIPSTIACNSPIFPEAGWYNESPFHHLTGTIRAPAKRSTPSHTPPRSPVPTQPRVWPSPSIRYLWVTISARPMGPRAWSFWVEIPISAPNPNTNPSVKRVEALTKMAAASTCS